MWTPWGAPWTSFRAPCVSRVSFSRKTRFWGRFSFWRPPSARKEQFIDHALGSFRNNDHMTLYSNSSSHIAGLVFVLLFVAQTIGSHTMSTKIWVCQLPYRNFVPELHWWKWSISSSWWRARRMAGSPSLLGVERTDWPRIQILFWCFSRSEGIKISLCYNEN